MISTQKYLAAVAVIAMMFAGFAVIAVGDEADAAVADKDIIITVDGVIEFAEGESAADFAPGVATVTSALDEAAVDALSAVKYDQYLEYIKPALKNVGGDMFAVYALADFDLTDIAFKNILDETTAYDKASGDGLTTMIVFDMNLAADLVIAAADADDAKAYAVALAQAFAVVPAGYYSQEEYEDALAVIPAGYISQADADAVKAAAVAAAIAGVTPAPVEPAKSPILGLAMDVFMYISIVLAAVLIAVTALFIYKVKPFKGLKIRKTKKVQKV